VKILLIDRTGAISVEQCFNTHAEMLSGPVALFVSRSLSRFWIPLELNDMLGIAG